MGFHLVIRIRCFCRAGTLLGGALLAMAVAGAGYPAAAQILYRDPDTGQLGMPPPGVEIEGSGKSAASARADSGEALVAEPIQVPGGGVMIDLRGRFRQTVTLETGPDGTGHLHCVPEGAAAR